MDCVNVTDAPAVEYSFCIVLIPQLHDRVRWWFYWWAAREDRKGSTLHPLCVNFEQYFKGLQQIYDDLLENSTREKLTWNVGDSGSPPYHS